MDTESTAKDRIGGGLMRADFVLVADASPEIGMGHAVRMYALAEELVRREQSVVFATRTPEYICERLTLPCAVERIAKDNVVQAECSVAVVDRGEVSVYCDYAIRFDDFGLRYETTSAIVNPHFVALPKYKQPAFLGPQWLPLRRGFSTAKSLRERYKGAPDSVYMRADAPAEIQEAVKRLPCHLRPKWDDITSARDASIAIVTASTTAYECMALGLPTLVYPQSEKHKPIADAMVSAGVALHWSDENLDRLLADEGLRRALGTRAREVVDGRGAERLASQLIRMAA